MSWIILLVVVFTVLVAVARITVSLPVWIVSISTVIVLLGLTGVLSAFSSGLLLLIFLTVMLPLSITKLRRVLISRHVLKHIKQALPPISETEKQAIDAGTVWWDAELFRGDPNWSKLLQTPTPALTERERSFIDGPVDELCRMLDDWQITHELNDLPSNVWEFLKQHRFFGMIIPESYGGHGFSALAHSTVVMKVAARSVSAGVTVMVPNSLGPAELLLKYGTDGQKEHYLPGLARGEEIPCFALTSPMAGSDASSITDYGIVCKGKYQGKQALGLRVTWEKRYITLGPVATVLGLAFKAYDPDYLLGDEVELGITCALIPTDTPGVKIGTRHYPLNASFQNGPNSGKDVFIPMDWIIGGQEQIGQGWRMLIESLSVGRGISLPAASTGLSKLACRMTGGYARIRKQFKLPIGRFEGVEEALARIGGLTYMMDAARLLTTSAIDLGEKPSVITAVVKYHLTEAMRQILNDAMDVHGGRGICMGPSNYLARMYQAVPINITVEGANILTRSMIIFGQGALRCHPYLVEEMSAANEESFDQALTAFDDALIHHLGYVTRNKIRSFIYGLSAKLAPSPLNGPVAVYYRRLARFSAAYAYLADVALLVLGGALKRKEKLSGRFADGLSYMYLASASLKHFKDQGQREEDRPLLDWSCQYCLYQVQSALDEILRNFPIFWLGVAIRVAIFPVGRRLRLPDDELSHRVASLLIEDNDSRDRLTQGIHINTDPQDVTGRIEDALAKVIAAEQIERRLRKDRLVQPVGVKNNDWLAELVDQKTITQEEADILEQAHAATRNVIMVDDFESKQSQRQVSNKRAVAN